MESIGARAVALLLGACLSAHAGIAFTSSGAGHIAVLIDGKVETSDSELLRVIASQMSDLDVGVTPVVLSRLPSSVEEYLSEEKTDDHLNSLAVVWIRSLDSRSTILFATDADGSRFLARRIDARDPGTMREAVALVVRSTVEVLIAGGQIGPSPPASPTLEPDIPFPPAAPGASSKDSPAHSTLIGLHTGYHLQVRSSRSLIHGLTTSIGLSPFPWLEIVAGYRFDAPLDATSRDTATIEIRRRPVLLGLAATHSSGRLSIGGAVDLVADFVSQRTTSTAVGGTSMKSNEDVIWGVAPNIVFRIRLVQRLEIFVGAGVEIPFNPVRYLFESSEGNRVVEEGWRVQPTISAGLRADLITKLRP